MDVRVVYLELVRVYYCVLLTDPFVTLMDSGLVRVQI